MKLIIICLIIAFSIFTCNAINVLRRRSHAYDLGATAAIRNWDAGTNTLTLTTTLADAGITPKASPTNLISLKWKEIKKTLLSKKKGATDKTPQEIAADEETMKKFLRVRLEDTLETIKVFTTSYDAYYPRDKNLYSAFTYSGTLKEITSSELTVKVDLSPTRLSNVRGSYKLRNTGSGKLSSDIDFQASFVNCKEGTTETPCSIYRILAAVRIFIQAFNYKFATNHAQSSLKAYDINMYSPDFGNPKILEEVASIKTDANCWRRFQAANRYAQLHIIYYDALKLFKEKHQDVASLLSNDVTQKLTEIMQASNKDNNNGGSFLLEMENSVILGANARSSKSDEDRNKAMVMHVKQAALNEANKCVAMCHVLASNFMALEAYVSYGSVSLMMVKQEALTEAAAGPSINEWIDYALQNFGYAVEHYYEAMHENDEDDAYSKLGKYTERLGDAVKRFDPPGHTPPPGPHKACWIAAFTAATLQLDSLGDRNVLKTHFMTHSDKIKPFFLSGYNCVKTHALALTRRRARHRHINQRNH